MAPSNALPISEIHILSHGTHLVIQMLPPPVTSTPSPF